MFFQKLFCRIHHWLLAKKLHRNKVLHKGLHYKDVKSVLLLFDATEDTAPSVAEFMRAKLEFDGKSVVSLAYKPAIRKDENVPFPYFSNKDISLFKVPSDSLLRQFMGIKADILLSLSMKDNLPLEYLAAVSESPFRVGRYIENKTYCFDLMISSSGNHDMHSFAETMLSYLKKVLHT